jgi:hypothetical protein
LADLAALTDDYFSVPEERIKGIESVLTIVGGKIVHARDEFAQHAPPALPVLPEWSPVKAFGGYGAPLDVRKAARAGVPVISRHAENRPHFGCGNALHGVFSAAEATRNRFTELWGAGCDCFAF